MNQLRLKTWLKIVEEQEAFLELLEGGMGREAVQAQKRLFEIMQKKYLDEFQRDEAGAVLSNARNFALVAEFEGLWKEYQKNTLSPMFTKFGEQLLAVMETSQKYWDMYGLAKPMEAYTKAQKGILKMIGMDIDGNFTKNGYMDKLLISDEIKSKVVNVLNQGVGTHSTFSGMKDRLGSIILGDADTNGAYERYFRQYVYDTFSVVQQAYDNAIADNVGLDYFVYAGTLINDSRSFCRQNVNQVFHRDILDDWENQEWAGKNWDVPVSVSVGGYNCRHHFRWIPDEMKDDNFGEEKK